MTAVGDIICMKVGAEKVNDLPDINDEDEKNSNLKKHRVFDKEKDKGKDKKSILDWLF